MRAWLSFGFAAVLLASQVAWAQPAPYRNVTAGGPLRHGVYGRIEVRGEVPPPPVIYKQPVIANAQVGAPAAAAMYLYVPPGQVRKWKQACAKWQACEAPVYFVRMDESPSRWGEWRHRREQVALQGFVD
jgi:hypothetical protein